MPVSRKRKATVDGDSIMLDNDEPGRSKIENAKKKKRLSSAERKVLVRARVDKLAATNTAADNKSPPGNNKSAPKASTTTSLGKNVASSKISDLSKTPKRTKKEKLAPARAKAALWNQQQQQQQQKQNPTPTARDTRTTLTLPPPLNMIEASDFFDASNHPTPLVVHRHHEDKEDFSCDLMGIYVPSKLPTTFQMNPEIPIYAYDYELTLEYFSIIHRLSLSAQRRLRDRGIFLNEPQICEYFLFADRSWTWFVYDPFKCETVSVCTSPLRPNEREFWTKPDSLYHQHSKAFSDWSHSQFNKHMRMAVTPIQMFTYATLLAKCEPRSPIAIPQANDFLFWNRDIVMHSRNSLKHLDCLMGVYTPLHMSYYGYPMWQLNLTKTNELMNNFPEKHVMKYLEKCGIRLNKCPTRVKSILKIYGKKFQVKKSDSVILKEIKAPVHEDDLLTKDDALFFLKEQAFGTWAFLQVGKWYEVNIALTPKDFFDSTLNRAALEVKLIEEEERSNSVQNAKEDNSITKRAETKKSIKKKKKKKKKKNKNGMVDDITAVEPTSTPDSNCIDENKKLVQNNHPDENCNGAKNSYQGPMEGNKKQEIDSTKDSGAQSVQSNKTQVAMGLCLDLSALLGINHNNNERSKSINTVDLCDHTLLKNFFDTCIEGNGWLLVEEPLTAPLFAEIFKNNNPLIDEKTKKRIKSKFNDLLEASVKHKRLDDFQQILSVSIYLPCITLCKLLNSLSKNRKNFNTNEKIVDIIIENCSIELESINETKLIIKSVNRKIRYESKKKLQNFLNDKRKILVRTSNDKESNCHSCNEKKHPKKIKNSSDISAVKLKKETGQFDASNTSKDLKGMNNIDLSDAHHRIEDALIWYNKLMEKFEEEICCKNTNDLEVSIDENILEYNAETLKPSVNEETELGVISSEAVVIELSKCQRLPKAKQEERITILEKSIDLSSWKHENEWTVDITEQAHKWFSKHMKRQHDLCVRVIKRLKLLSTGRWPYVLCKPLKTKKTLTKLYESKIDSGGRIIWEVATAFSPRRSSLKQYFCEQVIRVWDIVNDHDNLDRAIDLVVERIEKSYVRGQTSLLCSELTSSKSHTLTPKSTGTKVTIPRVFPMQQILRSCQSYLHHDDNFESKRFYPPASDDPTQFTLLKFYELNAGAIKMILDTKDENVELPFTPGPKEHEIINFKSSPQRSMLLMGRSGTGKTTCLVFRMWSQYMAYVENFDGEQPRQLFVTKNDILRKEVERSFHNMGLAWRKQQQPTEDFNHSLSNQNQMDKSSFKFPMFLSANEWLYLVDSELPGQSFFSEKELEYRANCLKDEENIQHGLEAILNGNETVDVDFRNKYIIRKKVTFETFKKLWPRINSRMKSSIDPALVWLEIKSYIKGSVPAMKIGENERDTQSRRFLTCEQYLALPRKQSKVNKQQRQIIYSLYQNYEKLKKESFFFDEMDVVYNIVGRLGLIQSPKKILNLKPGGLLPIDSLFVDEVQDFTQAELYLLTKLNRDPNNMMLAGDTAQSIAVGVGFRFTDIRQIFYQSFGGIEPVLLQLMYNYRSHAGVLRLAACVVELLYFFFSDSLDRLPPDLGLFEGPKPVIMEVRSTEELILMLDGSKRKTSRIEFGAHQVVIVRSEEAKKLLPDELNIDRDWVLTVQESKGLEFDDVLLYNFFTNSHASEMWRVVSNYKEDDIAAYYATEEDTPSSIKTFEWEELSLQKTRPLSFNVEEHKILENELKMLYTAITRARVNVFIAETDISICTPMFNYFKKRKVVKEVESNNISKEIEGVRVFGKMHSLDDWRKRGQYYFQNAEGERRRGCLRLAAKCFDKAGEIKKRDKTLAYLSFLEIEEQSGTSRKRRDEQKSDHISKLYEITAQLLEAEDITFLNKAGLCLLQSGERERKRCARIFELYAQLSFMKRQLSLSIDKSTNTIEVQENEKKYFIYAAKLFKQYSTNQRISVLEKADAILGVFRNLVSSGTKQDFKDAAEVIEKNVAQLPDKISQILDVCKSSKKYGHSPLTSFQKKFKSSDQCDCIVVAIQKLAKLSCNFFYRSNEIKKLNVAIEAITPRTERLQVLLELLQSDASASFSGLPWLSHHLFSNLTKNMSLSSTEREKTEIVMKHLVREFNIEGTPTKVIDLYEERGLLLEAADLTENREKHDSDYRYSQMFISNKAAVLRARYINLIAISPEWERHHGQVINLLKLLNKYIYYTKENAPIFVKACASAVQAKLNGTNENIQRAFQQCQRSTIWRIECIQILVKSYDFSKIVENVPGPDIWHKILFLVETASKTKSAALNLIEHSESRCIDQRTTDFEIEEYFYLKKSPVDPNGLITNNLTNLNLRQVIESENEVMPVSRMGSFDSTSLISRVKIRGIIAKYLFRLSFSLMRKLSSYLKDQVSLKQPCSLFRFRQSCTFGSKCKESNDTRVTSSIQYIELLQAQLLCEEEIKNIHNQSYYLFGNTNKNKKLWMKSDEDKQKQHTKKIAIQLCRYMQYANFLYFSRREDGDKTNIEPNCVVWRKSILEMLCNHASGHWKQLKLYVKKENLAETINYWRVLNFSQEKESVIPKIDAELKKIETHKSIQNDWENNKMGCYIKTKIKYDQNKKIRSAELFSRMWVWAVESIEEDFLNTLNVTKRLLKCTRNINGRINTFPKIDQISLLEVHAVGIFSLLSYRYCQAPTRQRCHWIVPRRSYLECLLLGKNDSSLTRGFGVPIKNVIRRAFDKHFFGLFSSIVSHLEFLSSTIVNDGFLSAPINTDAVNFDQQIARLERAICLSTFVCCNSTIFSEKGEDMKPGEAENEHNTLPKLPLGGSVKKLLGELKKTLKYCVENRLLHFGIGTIDEVSTLQDLLNANNLLLEESISDKFVYCRLQQNINDHDVDVSVVENVEAVSDILSLTVFDENEETFNNEGMDCIQFLEEQNNENDRINHQDEIQLSNMSKKTDERNAKMIIERSCRLWWKRKQSTELKKVSYFTHWKALMSKFIRLTKIKLEEKKKIHGILLDDEKKNENLLPLSSIPNKWKDLALRHEIFLKWSKEIRKWIPCFDDIECGFCGIMNDPYEANRRRKWCQMVNFVYCDEIVQYYKKQNNIRFEPNPLYYQHSQSSQHLENIKRYEYHVESLTEIASRFEISLLMLHHMEEVCKEEVYLNKKSWYMSLNDRVKTLKDKIHKAQAELLNIRIHWPIQHDFLHWFEPIKPLSWEAQQLYVESKEQEKIEFEDIDSVDHNDEEGDHYDY